MDGILDKLSPAQVLAALGILAGGVVAITMILSINRYQLRALADDTALKREQQQGELALRTRAFEHAKASGNANLEALLTPILTPDLTSSESDRKLDVQLATEFGQLATDPTDVESALRAALATPTAQKRAILEVMEQLAQYEADATVVLAAVRPLCRPVPQPVPVEL